jgi:flagellar biosynthetic protein FliP
MIRPVPLLLAGAGLLLLADPALAAAVPAAPAGTDAFARLIGETAGSAATPGGGTLALSLQLLLVMGLLTILPTMLLMMTSFTRILIVLSLLRQALGLQQTPPNTVLIGLSLFLSLFVMGPTLAAVNTRALEPYGKGEIEIAEAVVRSGEAFHAFMLGQTRKADLALFTDLAGTGPHASPEAVPFTVLLPAFVTSELKTAFQIGFLIFLPFLVIDLLVAAILMALGMVMMSPTIISLPFKLLLFVLVDGWAMTMGSLAASFGG